MSETESRPILCGVCNVEVGERTDPDGQAMAVCPKCGMTDTVENAIREAGDYLADKLAREALQPFENMRSTRSMKVTVTHSPQQTYRFILG